MSFWHGARDAVEFQQLRHLVAAVDCGNLLRAADECNISQSGLSRSIRSLETRLGVDLLIRKPKGVEPTVFGQSVVQRARLILNEVGRSIDELRSIQAAEIGDVTFAVTQNYGHYLLPEILAELNAAYPGVRVVVSTGGFLDLVERLQVGAIDFAFGLLGQIDEHSDITIEPLREHHSRVVCRAAHPLAVKGGEISPAELAQARWASLRGAGFQRSFADFFSSQGLSAPAQVIRSDSIALIREVITATDLLAVLPPDLVRQAVEAGALTILDCDAPAEQTNVGLMFRNHGLVTPQAQLVVDRIRRRLSPDV